MVFLFEFLYSIYQLLLIAYKSASTGSNNFGSSTVYTNFTTFLFVYFIIIIISFVFYYFYFKAIKYEIFDTEIHVFKGIITSTRKVVPMRTITNISVRRGLLDQLFRIGSIEIQTAGSVMITNQRLPVELLEGLPANMLEDLQNKIITLVRNLTKSREAKKINPKIQVDSDQQNRLILQQIEDIKDLLGNILNSK